MGRGKVKMKRIDDRRSRHVTFSKRRIGLMKKASQLSVLCGVEIAVIVFSGSGKLYDFSSSHSIEKTLERYKTYNEEIAVKNDDKPKSPTDHTSRLGTGAEPLELMSNLKLEHLSMMELTRVERNLDAILRQIRLRKTQLMMETLTTLAEKEKELAEEKHFLEKQIGAMIGRQTGDGHSRENDECRGQELQLIEPNDQGGDAMRFL